MSRLIDIEVERRCLCISFPYEPSLVDLVRTFPERFYDRQRRVWYVPLQHLRHVLDHLDQHHFKISPSLRRYCDEQEDALRAPPSGAAPTAPATSPVPDGSYTVSRLNQAARQALRQAFSDEIWLVAELQDYDKNVATNYRTYFFDLVERPAPGAAEMARIKAVVFEETRKLIDERLRTNGADIRLRDGLNVHLKGRVELYPQHGRYQLIVTDLDPSYTTGEIELNRERILRELERIGIAHRNASRPLPLCPLRIGLITSYESDAYNDFIHQLQSSGLGFDITLHHAQVQGLHTEASVLRALEYFADRADAFDAIAIIRGGGSRSDLAYFDTLPIGKAICEHPLKILCGVGHQRDQCLLDALSLSTKTPTAAAEALIHAVEQYELRIEERFGDIAAAAQDLVHTAQARHYRLSTSLERLATRRLTRAMSHHESLRNRYAHQTLDALRRRSGRLDRAAQKLGHHTRLRLGREAALLSHAERSISPPRLERTLRRPADELERLARRLIRASTRPLVEDVRRLQHLEDKLRLLDPQRVLERGFALVRDGKGHLLRNATDVALEDTLDIRLATGRLKARVDAVGPLDDSRTPED